MNITNIKEAITALAQSLQISTIFPASLFVLVNVYFVFDLSGAQQTDSPTFVTLVVSVTLILSYILYAYNYPLIRFLEGYKLERWSIRTWLLDIQRTRYTNKLKQIRFAEGELELIEIIHKFNPNKDDPSLLPVDVARKWRKYSQDYAKLSREYDLYFPADEASVLPTRLGNTIRAFEDYPRTRYGMDAVALWSRMIPVLKKTEFLPFVVQEKSILDFSLNSFLVVIVLGIELFYRHLYLGNWLWMIGVLVGTLVVGLILYEGIIVAARQWGSSVRVAFDMHRYELQKHLNLKTADSFVDDYQMWQEVSRFFLFRDEAKYGSHFRSSSEVLNSLAGDESKSH